ncbi:hypothetical protein BASA81_003737 [Batrachochytrium salamandrivorans]|nr:hypothetical protein BASA81_003737 [Batrachochytrium salamandrivorans]
MPPSAALLGFLKAKAASYEEVRKEVKTFHRLLLDVLEGPRQDSGADLIEPFFPLLRKLGAATLPLERQCLHMIYIIMCREIAPLGPRPGRHDCLTSTTRPPRPTTASCGPFRTATSSKSISDYHSPEDESLVLVTALNQPHNPLASACLAYFSGVVHATPPLALDVARSNLFASPPTCAEHSPINAQTVLRDPRQQDDRLEVAVFVCNQLASLPWQWLVSHPDKVLTDVVYKLSTALVDKRTPALVFAACESIQRLGRCKSTANSHAEVFVPWTGKLGRLCEDQTSCPGAEAAAALAWVGNPNSDMLFRLKQCPVEYANEVPPHSTHQLELALQGDLEQVVRFLDLANKVNSSEWETCLWELVIGHSQQSSPHAQRIVTKAERSLYLSGQLAVQKLAVQALAKTALLCPEQRLAAYQVSGRVRCAAESPRASPPRMGVGGRGLSLTARVGHERPQLPPTTPVDPRFPNTNQAHHCWTLYNEWVVCAKKNADDLDACKPARKNAQGICPNA